MRLALLKVKRRTEAITYLVFNDPKTGQEKRRNWVRDGNRSVSLPGMDRSAFVQKRNAE
ncbi:MAG: hypothetical protein ACOCX1_03265 [Fimbriimonadaceae bacterium]